MDEKVMALATLKAAQEAASWGFWSMISAMIGSVATLIAAGVAWRALHIWEKQEKFRLKQDFKRAVLQYLDISNVMPSIAASQERVISKDKFQQFQTAKISCRLFWTLSEDAFDEEVKILWEKLLTTHHEYMMLRTDICKVQDSAIELTNKLSIFKK